MATLWFILLAWMLATYVVLDGFDLGAGVLHLFVARSDGERDGVIKSIGPVWDGNEVWLIAAGGTMFLAFPRLLATSFSGFYLPLMIVLWLLIFRGLAIEMRHQLKDTLWTQFWDAAFFLASLLLAVCLGAALGNVVRGVPLSHQRLFFEPLWTDFRVGRITGVLDWYTVLVGLTATVALAHHGALWLTARTAGSVAERAGRQAGLLWPVVVVTMVGTTIATFVVQPHIGASLAAHPWGLVFPVLAVAGLAAAVLFRRGGRPWRAVIGSGVFLYGMLAAVAMGVYPYVLPARDPVRGLTLWDVAASPKGLSTALWWWIPGMLIACGYFVFLYRWLARRPPASGAAAG